jgi:hypothetical protein
LVVETHPFPWEYPFNAKPLFQELPNPNGEVVMDENVIVIFFCLLAKWQRSQFFQPRFHNLSVVQSLFSQTNQA